MTADLTETADRLGIAYFLIAFVDLGGVMRAKLVPAAAIGRMAAEGAGFAGFATWLDLSPARPDVVAIPDPSSLIQLPWRPEVGWLAADCFTEGAEIAQAPRNTLRRAIADAEAAGFRMKHGVECEFHLVTSDGAAIADPRDAAAKPCYDAGALMRRYDVIRAICDAMQTLGWGPYQADHEDANGQFELNWDYADALVTADRHAFFKYMTKSIAEAHGMRATFMPKPFAHLTGNGCHAHVSLWDLDGAGDRFAQDCGVLGLSDAALHFLGGLMHHAAALAAIAAPTVNSYKRLNAPGTRSGSTWSPNLITYGGDNRTVMVRVPGGRLELRLADGAANPYLLPAAILTAGMEGIASKRDPGAPLDIDVYAEGLRAESLGAGRLPRDLSEALRAFAADPVFAAGAWAETGPAFLKIKTAEWAEYGAHLTRWEIDTTLDC